MEAKIGKLCLSTNCGKPEIAGKFADFEPIFPVPPKAVFLADPMHIGG